MRRGRILVRGSMPNGQRKKVEATLLKRECLRLDEDVTRPNGTGGVKTWLPSNGSEPERVSHELALSRQFS
jgi:hypothetical protein